MIKDKRFVLVALAMVFLVLAILTRTGVLTLKSTRNFENLEYNTVLLADLVNLDSDSDGLLDWEESLYGTNPEEKDTSEKINEIQQNIENTEVAEENLTETDKFSRELFALVVTLNQDGQADAQKMAELGESLADKIGTVGARKVFTIRDLGKIKESNTETARRYSSDLWVIFSNYKSDVGVLDILQEFVGDGETENVSALLKLNPIIKQIEDIENELLIVPVPSTLTEEHLEMVNSMQRLLENLRDIKSFEADPMLTMNAAGQYRDNTLKAEIAIKNLWTSINKLIK